jgi:phosphate transport system protein
VPREAETREHIVKQFDADIAAFRQLVLKMGRVVSQQVRDACDAFVNDREALARMVVRREEWLDAMEVEADNRLIDLLVTRQPAGPDLRMVLALGWSIRDLERIGDEACRIAQGSLEQGRPRQAPGKSLLREVGDMSQQAISLMDGCLATLQSAHVGAAVSVARADEQLGDALSDALRRLATFVLEDSRNVGHVVSITLVLRSLERIGDHAKSVAQNVIYQVRGRDVRHLGSAAALARVLDLEGDSAD